MLSPEALSRRNVAHYELAEASLLAATPAMAPPQRVGMNLRWEELRNHLETRLYGLRSWRNSWWSHWARLAQNILPRRYHFLITPNSMTRGGEINEWIIDPTGTQALRICSAGMLNGLASPSDPWFKLRVGPAGAEIPFDVQQWLDIVGGQRSVGRIVLSQLRAHGRAMRRDVRTAQLQRRGAGPLEPEGRAT
jgi:hypothetical protein